MADAKLTALTAASALDGTELVYGSQGGNSRKITVAQIKTQVSNSPTLVTPALGTPSSGNLASCTGLPISTGVSGLGTGVATALGVNVGSSGAVVTQPAALTGNALKVLRVNAGETAFELATVSGGSGDVVGPASATDNAIVRYDGTTGKLIQNTGQTIDDSGKVVWDGTVGAGEKLHLWKIGGVNKAWIGEYGNGVFSGLEVTGGAKLIGTSDIFIDSSDARLGWGSHGAANAVFAYDATDTINQRNGTAAQKLRVSNTHTDASNYERFGIEWSGNVCYAKNANAGTGSARLFVPVTGSTTVAGLPSASTAGAGARSFVTDATATTFLSTVAGGGSNKVPVVSDGTNWLIG